MARLLSILLTATALTVLAITPNGLGLSNVGTVATATPSGPASTTYANAYGSGDRTATITITESNPNVLASETVLINGVDNTGAAYFNAYPTFINDGDWFSFSFPASIIIDEITWDQQTSATHGTWKVQGSADHSSWSDVGSSFTLGGSTTQVITALAGNTADYQYWRLYLVAGPSSNVPYLFEARFKNRLP